MSKWKGYEGKETVQFSVFSVNVYGKPWLCIAHLDSSVNNFYYSYENRLSDSSFFGLFNTLMCMNGL